MRRWLIALTGTLALLGLARVQAAAGPLVLSKAISGHILPNSVELTLTSNPDCDEAQKLAPDGSRLISDRFILSIDANGVGFFQGPVKIMTPDGVKIIEGNLHGTVGLIVPGKDTATGCILAGHLQGMLTGTTLPQLPPMVMSSITGTLPAPFEVNFTADIVPESAGIVPLYKGCLYGLVSPVASPPPDVLIIPSRPAYPSTEPIIALITNRSPSDIQVYDLESYCTIVQLERREETGWREVGPCMILRIPMPVVIKAGSQLKVALPPYAVNVNHLPGTYRMVLSWQLLDSTGKPVGDFHRSTSPLFQVVSATPAARLVVAPDRPAYRVTDPIKALIVNGPVPVRIMDEESLCTIVQLQRAVGTEWVLEAPCPLDRVALPVFLKPYEFRPVALVNSIPWSEGRYRLAVTYTPQDATTNALGEEQTAVSEMFPITAQ